MPDLEGRNRLREADIHLYEGTKSGGREAEKYWAPRPKAPTPNCSPQNIHTVAEHLADCQNLSPPGAKKVRVDFVGGIRTQQNIRDRARHFVYFPVDAARVTSKE